LLYYATRSRSKKLAGMIVMQWKKRKTENVGKTKGRNDEYMNKKLNGRATE